MYIAPVGPGVGTRAGVHSDFSRSASPQSLDGARHRPGNSDLRVVLIAKRLP